MKPLEEKFMEYMTKFNNTPKMREVMKDELGIKYLATLINATPQKLYPSSIDFCVMRSSLSFT